VRYQLEEARLKRSHQGWPVYRLKHLVRLIGGGTPSKENSEYWNNGSIPWVSPKDVKQRVISKTEDYVTEAAVRESATSFVDPRTPLMVVRSGILRHTIPVALAGRRLTINQDMKALRPDKRLDPRYFVYWVEGQSDDLLLEWRQLGATVESIDTEWMLNGRIALPDAETQKAIADFLDRETSRIDQLIEKKQKLIDLIHEREESVFLGAVTGKNVAGERSSSGVEWIGTIPAHWLAPKFTQVARQETGHTPSRKEPSYWVPEECVIPWVSLADIWQIRKGNRIYISDTAEKISQVGMDNSAARLLPTNTVILSRTASVGFPAIVTKPMATTQDFACWICGKNLRPKYLYYVLRAMKPEFRRLMMGSTHQTIYMPDIRAFRTPLPTLEEQDVIVQKLDASLGKFREVASAVEASIKRLHELRAALISAAVTGQIDVESWGKRGVTDSRLDRLETELEPPAKAASAGSG